MTRKGSDDERVLGGVAARLELVDRADVLLHAPRLRRRDPVLVVAQDLGEACDQLRERDQLWSARTGRRVGAMLGRFHEIGLFVKLHFT